MNRALLLVEDDRETQALIRLVLRRECDVLVAASAEQAREALARHGERVRLVLLDLRLEGPEDGVELARQLRRDPRWRTLPIVAATACTLPEDRARSFAAGCNAFLAKPIYPRDLRKTVRRYLGG
jgi:two-component system, cell cycle response regulator DivK